MTITYSTMPKIFSKTTNAVIVLVISALFSLAAAVPATADEAAEKLLERIRYGATLQHNKLEGHIRKNGKRTPLSLHMRGEDITFQFYTEKKWTGFHMQLKEGQANLFETIGGKAKPFPPQKIGEAIIGSDVTYEDLSLRFLYWKDAKIEGQEKIKMQACHKIRLNNPGKDGRYKTVYIWVHQKYGALMGNFK